MERCRHAGILRIVLDRDPVSTLRNSGDDDLLRHIPLSKGWNSDHWTCAQGCSLFMAHPDKNDDQYDEWFVTKFNGDTGYQFTFDELKRMQLLVWAAVKYTDTALIDDWVKGYIVRAINVDRDWLAFYK